jgi:CPA2 family monovalent cation:H+ antiporter-2
VAVSSTAIVLRGLQRRGELDVPHGQLAVGILVFQDLCVVPMMLAVPFLAGQGGSAGEVAITGAKAVGVLGGVLLAARLVVPRLLAFVARTRERDLFVLSVFLICLGIAWAASTAGVSLALGAFLAGLVVAGSEFRHRALTDLIPAREVLASIFFVSVGMLLDVRDVFQQILPTAGLLVAILVGKFAIVLATALALRLPLRVGILTATTLCQVGEFSFVLLAAASGTGLLGGDLSHNLLVAVILSMLLTPVAIAFGPHLASGAARVPWLNRRLGVRTPGSKRVHDMAGHVIVAGCALAGERVTRELREAGVPYVGVDLNPLNVRRARQAGTRVFLADVTHAEVLEEMGIENARLLVIAINDPRAAERTLRTARSIREDLPIIVRAPYALDERALRKAGATEVVVAESEAARALSLATRAHLREGAERT